MNRRSPTRLRWQAALVAASLLVALGGCGSYRQTRAGGAGVMSAGLIVAGLAGMAYLLTSADPTLDGAEKVEDKRDARNVAIGAGLVAAVGLALLVYGNNGAAGEEAEERRETEARYQTYLLAQGRARERAVVSTQQAAAEARGGNCELSVIRDPIIHDLDAEVHATVFLRDVAIKACLYAASKVGKERIAQQRRQQAFALMKTATEAAHTGNCDAVRDLRFKIRALDNYVHDAWFVRDAAIKPCLAEGDAPALPQN